MTLDMAKMLCMVERATQGEAEGPDYTEHKFVLSAKGTGIRSDEYLITLDTAKMLCMVERTPWRQTPHKHWVPRRIHGLDYTCCKSATSSFGTGTKSIEYHFSLDMAQQIAMTEDTEQGDIEGLDYTWRKFAPSPFGTGTKPIEYHFSLDMAQQIAMMEDTKQGERSTPC